ncbi:NUDIX domain-containing protein [Cryomorphaceae bacterium 1068]|nr:NUDIX domain-containing protein [Cryomorphaceae bacterium 1068]
MYKVFINNKSIVLTDRRIPDAIGDNQVYLTYDDFEELSYTINLLENSHHLEGVIFYYHDLEMLWADFRAHFKEIEAAGGLVHNENNEYLLIFRKGKWDLPKGKIDEGETPEQAALREVEEECGVSDLKIGEALAPSYHTYEQDGVRILKKTYWYDMTSAQQEFTPQAEEDIEKVQWQDLGANIVEGLDTYPNIRVILGGVIAPL